MPPTSYLNRKEVTYRLIRRIGVCDHQEAILPIFGMLMGLSLGHSIKLGLFVCSVIGGAGWLIVFKRFNIDNRIIFMVSIFLGF